MKLYESDICIHDLYSGNNIYWIISMVFKGSSSRSNTLLQIRQTAPHKFIEYISLRTGIYLMFFIFITSVYPLGSKISKRERESFDFMNKCSYAILCLSYSRKYSSIGFCLFIYHYFDVRLVVVGCSVNWKHMIP